MPTFNGLVEIQNGDQNTTISLDGDTAVLEAGGNGSIGRLILYDAAGAIGDPASATLSLDAQTAALRLGTNGAHGSISVFRSNGDSTDVATATLHFNGQTGDVRAGGNGVDGDVVLQAANGEDRIRLDGGGGNGWFGGNGADGDLVLFRADGDNATAAGSTLHLDGQGGGIRAGGNGATGDVRLQGQGGETRVRLEGGAGNVWLGGNGADGDLVLFNTEGDNATLEQATIHLDGQGGNGWFGGNGTDGDLVLRGADREDRIRLDAGGGNIWLGGNGADGDLVLFADSGDNQTLAEATIHLNGQSGDIILQNGDCAEDFEVEAGSELDPGSVVVLNERARLETSQRPYDRRVAGIVAGAGTLKPGIILGRKADDEKRLPVALMGRVFCKVDARFGDIEVGDLLTTSPTPGHAMRATDGARALGSVIGKALAKITGGGTGLIPVLVALQ